MTDIPAPAAAAVPTGGRMPASQAMDAIRPEYSKDGPSLFWLSFRLVLLTIFTLGIYRFWMTTNLRRHYWGAIRVNGDPLEYTGTGLEKLLGFLIALVVLALYLAIINLGLTFAGLFSLDDPIQLQLTLQLSLLATLPLIFYATYRARRYILARTRWRGIRFGMDLAAWKYTGRAIPLVLLTIVTLGIAYPYQHFKLEKFKLDRTWFGDLQFHQGGTWRELLGYWIWFYVIGVLVIASFAAIAMYPESPTAITIGVSLVSFGYLAVFLIGLRYQVAAFRYLWENRSLGETSFRNDIDTGEVMGVYIGGSLAIGICTLLLSLVFAAILFGAFFLVGLGIDFESLAGAASDETSGNPLATKWPIIVTIVMFYLAMVGFGIAFSQVFIVRPILRRKAEGMQVFNIAALAHSQQRAHDRAAEAGGFADALGVDVGAGF